MLRHTDFFQPFKEGEEQAFRQVFETYYRPVCYFALKILEDEQDAEDIASDTFRKAWKHRARFATPRHLRNFLYLVTRNACISQLRADLTAKDNEEDYLYQAEEAVEADQPLDLERAQTRMMESIYEKISTLPGGHILHMHFIERKSILEIAKLLNMSENNVSKQKERALAKLRKMLPDKEWLLFAFVFLGR